MVAQSTLLLTDVVRHEAKPLVGEIDDYDPLLKMDGSATTALREPKLERAIGVIYRPETERCSHYFHARLSEQFDAVVHFDETRAVEPLERTSEWDVGEVPETFPTGI